MKNIGKAVKFVVVFMVFAVIALFVFRVIVQSDKHRLNTVTGNSVLADRYTDSEDKITAVTHDIVDDLSEDGYFMMYAFVYFPDANQLQITVQYNSKSVCSYAERDFTDKDSDVKFHIEPDDIRFTLGVSDSGANEITPTIAGEDSFWMYTYQRLVFDNVTLTEDDDLIIYMYGGDSTMLSSYVLHYSEQPFEDYKLSSKEIKAITENK